MMNTPIDRSRLYFPALGGLYDIVAPYCYPLVRFAAGAILVPHGIQKLLYGAAANTAKSMAAKGFPFPQQLANGIGVLELVAGATVAIGLFTRVGAALLWMQMAVITVLYTGPRGYFWNKGGFEFSLLWLLLFTAILFRGGGRYSVDHHMRKEF
jgi:putative oxidoreductase